MESDEEDDYVTDSPLTKIKQSLADKLVEGIPDLEVIDGSTGELLASSRTAPSDAD